MEFPRNAFITRAKEKNRTDGYIAATLEYADALSIKSYPVIFSLVHFCILSGCDYLELKKAIKNPPYSYKLFPIKKKRGGSRMIYAVQGELKKAQKFIAAHILTKYPISRSVFGYVSNRSIYDNAKLHVGQPHIRTFDISDFFGSISRKRVADIFREIGYISNLAIDFGKICTVNLGRHGYAYLPQGSPASPALSNIVMKHFDLRMETFAAKHELKYSRYADDFTFSGNLENLPKPSFIERVLRSEGFMLNHKKTRTYGPKSTRRLVTGLLVTDQGVRVQPAFKKEIKQHLYYIEKFGPRSHIEFLNTKRGERKNYYYKWLRGKLLFLNMVEPEVARPMLNKLDEFDWGI